MASKYGDGNFSVQIRSRELVTAEIPQPESWLPLSNLDLAMAAAYPSYFFVYTKRQCEFGSMISTLKKALSKLLLPFYPLAGVMVTNPAGEPELHCNHRGIEFIEAYADVKLCNLNLHDPRASLKGKLVVPELVEGAVVSLQQVTELRCGSVVVSCTTDHRICDLYSTNMLLEAWAEMARTGTISVKPSFRRSLLSPRRPGLSGKLIDHETYVVLPLPPAVSHVPSVDNHVSRIYHMRAQDMEKIQDLASHHGARRSKLEALSGCLWKAVAKRASAGDTCKLGISVDGRSKLIQDGGSRVAMDRYFGNVLSCPHGELDADELRKRPLSWVADRIHDFLETTTTKEYFLGLIDWLEASRPYPVLPKVFCRGSKDGLSLVVSHGRPFQVKKLDFGWGRPAVGSIYFPDENCVGYVMLLPSPSDKGDWVIFMNVFPHQLESIEAALGDVLHPLSVEHFN